MGDIDDFFAKKDKKKKGTKKFSKANTDVLAKNLQENERKEQKELERQGKDLGIPMPEDKAVTILSSQDDEEWDDYRDNKKDYSGLKIEALKIEEPVEEPEEETEVNEDGEIVAKKKEDGGPWNKLVGSGGQNETESQEAKVEQEPEPAMKNVVKGSYVPPHLRGESAAEPVRKPMSGRGGKFRAAPDITNEVSFPTLSAAVEDAAVNAKGRGGGGVWGRARGQEDEGLFEEVREGGKQGGGHSRHAAAPRLQLGNKFDALRDGD